MILAILSHFQDVLDIIYNIFHSLINILDTTYFFNDQGFSVLDFMLVFLIISAILGILINSTKIGGVDK